jgi:APA family basic amino acid/polyamine antiporter
MALDHVEPGQDWATAIVALGSVIAHTAVLLVFQLGQPRIFFSMARDGLLPPSFARVHPKYRTPHVTTILTGVVVGGVAAFASIDEMVDLTNIGTLFAFVLVCIGVPILRYTDPNRPRPFRVPFGPFLLPLLGVVSCLFLMVYLPPASWWRFIGWLVLGFSIYSAYGYSRSAIGQRLGRPARASGPLKVASLGFLLTAIGLFTIPHHAGLGELLAQALSAAAEDHTRSLAGLSLIVVGLVLGMAGLYLETGSRRSGAGTPP